MSDDEREVKVPLTPEEIHILVSYCYSHREAAGEQFTEREQRLMDKLLTFRGEHAEFLP